MNGLHIRFAQCKLFNKGQIVWLIKVLHLKHPSYPAFINLQ